MYTIFSDDAAFLSAVERLQVGDRVVLEPMRGATSIGEKQEVMLLPSGRYAILGSYPNIEYAQVVSLDYIVPHDVFSQWAKRIRAFLRGKISVHYPEENDDFRKKNLPTQEEGEYLERKNVKMRAFQRVNLNS